MSGQGFLSRLKLGAAGMRRLFNLWPVFRGMGVRVVELDPALSHTTYWSPRRCIIRIMNHGSAMAKSEPPKCVPT